jgi:hypothetical protein
VSYLINNNILQSNSNQFAIQNARSHLLNNTNNYTISTNTGAYSISGSANFNIGLPLASGAYNIVGSTVFADTLAEASGAYSIVGTSTFKVGLPVSTGAYSVIGVSTFKIGSSLSTGSYSIVGTAVLLKPYKLSTIADAYSINGSAGLYLNEYFGSGVFNVNGSSSKLSKTTILYTAVIIPFYPHYDIVGSSNLIKNPLLPTYFGSTRNRGKYWKRY